MPTRDELVEFFEEQFPQANICIDAVGSREARIRREVGEADLRPGGTISGPTIMGLADAALYVAILGEIGIVPLAVTTNLTFNFFKKPAPNRALTAHCTLLKVGKSLAVGEVSVYSQGNDEPVAHAVGTYSIPPSR